MDTYEGRGAQDGLSEAVRGARKAAPAPGPIAPCTYELKLSS
jgi:hypothetical protein